MMKNVLKQSDGTTYCWLLVITAVTYFMPRVSAQVADIIVPPKSVNVSSNGVANFSCTAVATANVVWKRNGNDINNGMGVAITDTIVNEMLNIRKSSLKLTVSSLVNNTAEITCTAVKLSPFSSDESQPAQLLIQGLLESVNNLTVVSINSTTVLISWSPPFTLEGVPILGYNVTISVSGENKTILVEGDTAMLYYMVDNPDSIQDLTVTMAPINEVGTGRTATFYESIKKLFNNGTTEVIITQVLGIVPSTTTNYQQNTTTSRIQSTILTQSPSLPVTPNEYITTVVPWVVLAIVTVLFAILLTVAVIIIFKMRNQARKQLQRITRIGSRKIVLKKSWTWTQ